jgi:hypothetical protein
MLFDREGKAAASWHGAPPTLHAEVEGRLEAVAAPAASQDR